MRYLLVLFLVLLLSSSCAIPCKTIASYEIAMESGQAMIRKVSYESCKEQIGLDAEFYATGAPKHVKVDKASPDNANMLILESNKLMLEAFKIGVDTATKAAMSAATKGVVR